ncbi:restriction endonuclease [Streptomyces sp. NPDC005900]|uniref:restriction endonuclease n=1 Tax=Streptomyces sp. NPDC005900 TaxID=3154569 RepID=UPI0033F58812
MAALTRPARRRPRLRSTRTRPARRSRTRRRVLPTLSWGWYATAALVLLAAFKSWPLQTLTALTAAAALTALTVKRPHLRSVLPRQRTAATFHQLSPSRFEHAVAHLARTDPRVRGAAVVGGTGDGGIDIRVELNDGTHWFIQCKRNKQGNNVGSGVIRDANGAYRDLHSCHRAAIVTTADFTAQAYATNDRLHRPLTLFTGQDLTRWAGGGPAPWERSAYGRG